MKFRTEIEPLRGVAPIDCHSKIAMLGSCFTTEVGARLLADGFDVMANPMGPLYNPASLARVVNRALEGRAYAASDFARHDDAYHALDFPSRYQGDHPDVLAEKVNSDFQHLSMKLQAADLWIITFGTSHIFEYEGNSIVGNCHKLPTSKFTDRYLSVDEIVALWEPLTRGRRIIFTVSPIRHIADGLHGNQLSKARLLLAIDELCRAGKAEYFPSYEILLDDLRDYRFYTSDMKHPSETAVDYIYERFSESYFTTATRTMALAARKASLRSQHRPIL
ncbi:MAG: GSCFA domain-containing protein [Muribaculaceae bacterium]|nr:GSCFA domain-containing protein [Muribaculaceae bacterium]